MSEENRSLDVYLDTYDNIKSYTQAQPGSLYFSSDKPALFYGAGGSNLPVEAYTAEDADSALASLREDIDDLEDATDTKLSEMFKQSYLAPSQGLTFELSDDGSYYSVTNIGTCTDAWVVIPETYKGLPVTTVARAAFQNISNIQAITLSKNINNLGSWAIADCPRLVYIEFLYPDQITFDENAVNNGTNPYLHTFYKDGDNINETESPPFKHINKRARLVDGKYLFCEKETTSGIICVLLTQVGDCTHVVLPNTPGAEDTKYVVESGAFSGAGVKSIKFSDDVGSINRHAFANNTQLTSITIPDSVEGIEEGILKDCSSLVYLDVPFIGKNKDDFQSITYLIGNPPVDKPSSITTLIVRGGILNRDTLSSEASEDGVFRKGILPKLEVAKFDTTVKYSYQDNQDSGGYSQLLAGCRALKQLDICFPKTTQSTAILLGNLFADGSKVEPDDNYYVAYQGGGGANYRIPKSLTDVTIHGYIYQYSLSGCTSVTNWTIDTKWNNFYTDGSTINSDMNMFAIPPVAGGPSAYNPEFPDNTSFNITIDCTNSSPAYGAHSYYVSLPELRPLFVEDSSGSPPSLYPRLYCKARLTLAAINVPEKNGKAVVLRVPDKFYSNDSPVDSGGTPVFYERAQLAELSIIAEENPVQADAGSITDRGDLLRVSVTGQVVDIGSNAIQAAQDRDGLDAALDRFILHIKTDKCIFQSSSDDPCIKTDYMYGNQSKFRAITIEHEPEDPNKTPSITVRSGCLGTSGSSRVCVITDRDSSDKWKTAWENAMRASGLEKLTTASDTTGYSIETRS